MKNRFAVSAKFLAIAGTTLIAAAVPLKAHAVWCITQAVTGAGVQCQPWVFLTPFCAPEVAEGNLKATDRILRTLTQEPEFGSATKFKSVIAQTAKLSNETRMAAYLELVDVNPRDTEALVEFIGAREPKAKHLNALERNLSLSSQQAEIVAQRLSEGLRGGIQ